jgi:glycerate 2-kinase
VMNYRQIALDIYFNALKAVLPETLIRETLKLEGNDLVVANRRYPLGSRRNLFVFGSGKASAGAAKAVTELLGDRIAGGLVVSNYEAELDRIRVVVGAHPVPDARSVIAAEMLMQGLAGLSEDDFFIYLLSGGSSALIEKPIPPLTLQDLQDMSQLLLRAGAPIAGMNVVRKHLSLLKGGRLGRRTKARGVVLVISDVIGDDLETIGSAPLYRDRSSYSDVCDILSRYNLWEKIPAAVRTLVEGGRAGEGEDTPKEASPCIDHLLIGNNRKALKKAKEQAESLGMKAYILTSRLEGEARDVAKSLIAIGREILKDRKPSEPPVCLLFGGETTVTVRGSGKGGRNQELCLAALQEIGNRDGLLLLSAGTDGIDGNSEAAGALVDAACWKRARELGLSIDDYLERNDSSRFFEQTGGLIRTGPTGTNVMDIVILLIGRNGF